MARGNARARLQNAEAYTLSRVNRAEGDANRFTQREAGFRTAPGPTETRLYLEAMDLVLPGKTKFIVDRTKAPRRLFLIEDSVEIAGPALSPLLAPKTPQEER